MIHPYHPLSGREFEFVEYRRQWGEDRVWVKDETGQVLSIPAQWTSLGVQDPFVVIGGGRCHFRVQDLAELKKLIVAVGAEQAGGV